MALRTDLQEARTTPLQQPCIVNSDHTSLIRSTHSRISSLVLTAVSVQAVTNIWAPITLRTSQEVVGNPIFHNPPRPPPDADYPQHYA